MLWDVEETPANPTRESLLLLVRGGAEPPDAADSLGIDQETLTEWLGDEGFASEVSRAEGHARAMVDAGQRKGRPGEWERRQNKPGAVERHPTDPMRVRCTARSKQTKRPCTKWSERGTNICRYHGALAPQTQSIAHRRLARHTVGELMAKVGRTDVDPIEALLEELQRSAAMAEALQLMVAELGSDPHVGDAWWNIDASGTGRPHVLIEMLAEERDRKTRYAKLALDAGVAERVVRVQEQHAALFARIIAAVIDDASLALTGEQRLAAREVAARHLRALPSAS